MIPGLQFFNFVGDEDGEDIKIEFKKRITEAELLLTQGEKKDIIAEAHHIFKFMVELIGDLDVVMGMQDEDVVKAQTQQCRSLMSSRDSVTVARERLLGKTAPTENRDMNRKSTYLQDLPSGPVAKFVRFKGFPGWHMVMNALGRRFSKDGPPSHVSFESEKGTVSGREMNLVSFDSLNTIMPIVVILAFWVFWYCNVF